MIDIRAVFLFFLVLELVNAVIMIRIPFSFHVRMYVDYRLWYSIIGVICIFTSYNSI